MISARACDLCDRPLQTDVVRLTMRRGQVAFLVQQRWKIQSRPAGLQQMTICRPCHDVLATTLAELTARLAPDAAPAPATGATTEAA